MAHIDDGGDGRRSTSVDLNLVPIIDLMSVCIIFLLITAVWTQVSMIQLGSSLESKATDSKPPDIPKDKHIPFRLDVLKEGYRVIIGSQEKRIPKVNGAYDQERLVKELKAIKELYPEKTDSYVTILDELAYEHLIGGMDAMLQAGFPQIGIPTGGSPP